MHRRQRGDLRRHGEHPGQECRLHFIERDDRQIFALFWSRREASGLRLGSAVTDPAPA